MGNEELFQIVANVLAALTLTLGVWVFSLITGANPVYGIGALLIYKELSKGQRL